MSLQGYLQTRPLRQYKNQQRQYYTWFKYFSPKYYLVEIGTHTLA